MSDSDEVRERSPFASPWVIASGLIVIVIVANGYHAVAERIAIAHAFADPYGGRARNGLRFSAVLRR